MAAFKEGDQVRLRAPVVEGGVTDIQFNKSAGELEYLVAYTDGNGESQTRWFGESELEIANAK
jgi:hypothetical protein